VRKVVGRFGSLAVAGLLVAGFELVVALAGLRQSETAVREENAGQATVVAILDEQLAVQRQIVSLQRVDVRAAPTATAVAARMVSLASTQEALEADRRAAEATLTAEATRAAASPLGTRAAGECPTVHCPTAPPCPAAASPEPTAVPRVVESQVPGLSAERLEFSRFENTVTVKVRLVNGGEQEPYVRVGYDSYLLDEASLQKIPAADASDLSVPVPAGQSIVVWAKYGLPEGAQPAYLTVVCPHGVLFEHNALPSGQR